MYAVMIPCFKAFTHRASAASARARVAADARLSHVGADHTDLEDHYVIATFVCVVYGCISIKATTSANNYGEAVCPIKSKKD